MAIMAQPKTIGARGDVSGSMSLQKIFDGRPQDSQRPNVTDMFGSGCSYIVLNTY